MQLIDSHPAVQEAIRRHRLVCGQPVPGFKATPGTEVYDHIARAGVAMIAAGQNLPPLPHNAAPDAATLVAHVTARCELIQAETDYRTWIVSPESEPKPRAARVGRDWAGTSAVFPVSPEEFIAAVFAQHAAHPVYSKWASELRRQDEAKAAQIREAGERAAAEYNAKAAERALALAESSGWLLALNKTGQIIAPAGSAISDDGIAGVIEHRDEIVAILKTRRDAAAPVVIV